MYIIQVPEVSANFSVRIIVSLLGIIEDFEAF